MWKTHHTSTRLQIWIQENKMECRLIANTVTPTCLYIFLYLFVLIKALNRMQEKFWITTKVTKPKNDDITIMQGK